MNKASGALLALVMAAQFAQPASAIPGNHRMWRKVWDATQGVWVWVKKNPVPAAVGGYGVYSGAEDVYEDYRQCVNAIKNGAGKDNESLTKDLCGHAHRIRQERNQGGR